jgi:hypothetical protein
MLRALLLGAARRVQRVGKKQQTCSQFGLLGREHAGLAAAIGVAGKEDSRPRFGNREEWATRKFFHRGHGVPDAGAVPRGIARCGRTEGPELTKRQVAAQDRDPRIGERFRKRAQKRSLGVGSRAVSQNDGVAIGSSGGMQKSPDGWVEGGVGKFADGGRGQQNILDPRWSAVNDSWQPVSGIVTLFDANHHELPGVCVTLNRPSVGERSPGTRRPGKGAGVVPPQPRCASPSTRGTPASGRARCARPPPQSLPTMIRGVESERLPRAR